MSLSIQVSKIVNGINNLRAKHATGRKQNDTNKNKNCGIKS